MKIMMSRDQLDRAVAEYLQERGMVEGRGRLKTVLVVDTDDPDPTSSVRVECEWTPEGN